MKNMWKELKKWSQEASQRQSQEASQRQSQEDPNLQARRGLLYAQAETLNLNARDSDDYVIRNMGKQ